MRIKITHLNDTQVQFANGSADISFLIGREFDVVEEIGSSVRVEYRDDSLILDEDEYEIVGEA